MVLPDTIHLLKSVPWAASNVRLDGYEVGGREGGREERGKEGSREAGRCEGDGGKCNSKLPGLTWHINLRSNRLYWELGKT